MSRTATIDVTAARKLRKEGKILAEIAKALGCSRTGLSYHLGGDRKGRPTKAPLLGRFYREGITVSELARAAGVDRKTARTFLSQLE